MTNDPSTLRKIAEAATLKPCPFCGGSASVEEIMLGDVSNYSVGCAADEATCMGYQSLTQFARRCEAIAAWNRRTPDPEQKDATIERMRAALVQIRDYGGDYTTGDGHAKCREIARAALDPDNASQEIKGVGRG